MTIVCVVTKKVNKPAAFTVKWY